MKLGAGYGEQNFIATYCVLRTIKPARVIEVGSGVSTYGTLAALKRNEVETDTHATITAIEPFPRAQFASFRSYRAHRGASPKRLDGYVPQDGKR